MTTVRKVGLPNPIILCCVLPLAPANKKAGRQADSRRRNNVSHAVRFNLDADFVIQQERSKCSG